MVTYYMTVKRTEGYRVAMSILDAYSLCSRAFRSSVDISAGSAYMGCFAKRLPIKGQESLPSKASATAPRFWKMKVG
jgi:hypothetical protein